MAKIKLSTGCSAFLSEGSGKNPLPCLPQLTEASHMPWLVTPPHHLQSQQQETDPISLILSSASLFSF